MTNNMKELIEKMKKELERANLEPNVPEVEPKPCESEYGESLLPEQVKGLTIAEESFKKMLIQFLSNDIEVVGHIIHIIKEALSNERYRKTSLGVYNKLPKE